MKQLYSFDVWSARRKKTVKKRERETDKRAVSLLHRGSVQWASPFIVGCVHEPQGEQSSYRVVLYVYVAPVADALPKCALEFFVGILH